ncbi:MAG TPA: hypothetical protein VKK31_03450 [Thermoanaerobaculia bacterium]|nr:hypothetical protein [Thermoanaerobaculia bacterium]
MPLKKRLLIQRSVVKALRSPLNLTAGAAGLGAAWWLHDPLPAMVWGAVAAGWVVVSTATRRYRPRIEEEERRRREAREGRERELLRQNTQRMLEANPFNLWTRAGYLPDYMTVYQRLAETRNRVSRVLAERQDLDAFTKEDVLQQLSYMLKAYLGFVRERVSYLQILAGVAPTPEPPGSPAAVPGWRKDWRLLSARIASSFVPPIPSLEKRLAEVEQRIRQTSELALREPATARTRQFHISILEKQRELLLDCHKRDQCVVAQLGTFSDAFEVIHGRLSTSQFNAVEVASYMSHLVEQIVETERFVETLRPAMDDLMAGLDPLPAPARGYARA